MDGPDHEGTENIKCYSLKCLSWKFHHNREALRVIFFSGSDGYHLAIFSAPVTSFTAFVAITLFRAILTLGMTILECSQALYLRNEFLPSNKCLTRHDA